MQRPTTPPCPVPPPSSCPGLYAGPREARRARLVLLPLGSYEDRDTGPMVLDTLFALVSACTASKQCGALVAWPLGYGYSPAHRYWAGLGPGLLRETVSSIIEGLRRASPGAVIVVVDGHYGHRGVVEGAAESSGALYFNTWSYAIREAGLSSLAEQFWFEEKLWESLVSCRFSASVERVVRGIASRLCGFAEEAG